MKWFPWISREHHEAVIAGKDALIRSLECQNAVLAERLAEPVKVTVEFPERLSAPKAPESPAKEKMPRKAKALPEIDFATLDERDPIQMSALAAQEFGDKLPSPYILQRWYSQVRAQIQYSRRKRQQQADQTGSVGTIIVDPEQVSAAGPAAPPPPTNVPAHILQLVEAAERGA